MELIKKYYIKGEDGCMCELTEEVWNFLDTEEKRKLAEQDKAGDAEGANNPDTVNQFEEDMEENAKLADGEEHDYDNDNEEDE